MGTVIVIDPDVDSREILTTVLRHSGHGVVTCSDPAGGIAAAIEQRPVAILTELFIRTDRGWAILEFLRANPATEAIPVVAVSCQTTPDDRARALRSGAIRFLAKPVRLQEVLDALREVLMASGVASCGR